MNTTPDAAREPWERSHSRAMHCAAACVTAAQAISAAISELRGSGHPWPAGAEQVRAGFVSKAAQFTAFAESNEEARHDH